ADGGAVGAVDPAVRLPGDHAEAGRGLAGLAPGPPGPGRGRAGQHRRGAGACAGAAGLCAVVPVAGGPAAAPVRAESAKVAPMARALASTGLSAGQTRPATGDIHDNPWVTLIYCVFVFAPLAFIGLYWRPWLASVLATLAFLPLHFRFYRTPPARGRGPLVLGAALIGFALLPFNPGGNTFIAYACAMAGWAFPARRAVLTGAVLIVLMVAEYFLVLPWRYAIAWSTMASLVTVLV